LQPSKNRWRRASRHYRRSSRTSDRTFHQCLHLGRSRSRGPNPRNPQRRDNNPDPPAVATGRKRPQDASRCSSRSGPPILTHQRARRFPCARREDARRCFSGEAQRPICMTLASPPLIGSTPEDTLLAALDSLLASPIPARSPMGTAPWPPMRRRWPTARRRPRAGSSFATRRGESPRTSPSCRSC
jgi:hypothetical protein